MSEPVDRNSADQDRDLAEYLGGDSQVSQRYRALDGATDAAVPPELDRLILAQARRAVAPAAPATASRFDELAGSDELAIRGKRRRLLQWGVPTALAASLVLVVSIVMRSGVEHEVRGMTMLPTAPVENRLPEPAKDLPPPASARQDAVAPPNEQESAARPMSKKSSGVAVKSERANAEQALAGSVAHRNRNADRSPDQSPDRKQDVELARESHAAMANDAAPSPPSESKRVPAAQAPPPPPEPSLAPAVEAPSPAATTPVRQSTSAVPPVRQNANVTKANETRDAATMARMMSKERNELSAAAKVAPGVPAAEEVDTAQLRADPEAWLKHIRQLREQGKRELADREWERFSAEYPAYPVAETDPARAAKTP